MSGYSYEEQTFDSHRVSAALLNIAKQREIFSDVIVIPSVITIHDVCNIDLDTTKGPQRIGDVCSREEIVHILRAFQDNPCGDPILIAQYALDDYRQTHTANKE
jgi:hypothetical protein